jgi:hypothetical protein
MKQLIISAVIPFLLAFSGVPSWGRDLKTLDKTVPADPKIKEVHLSADIGPANLAIDTHDGKDLFIGSVRYDADRINADIEYEARGSSADVYVTAKQYGHKWQVDTDDDRWNMSLSRDYHWDLSLDIGMGDSRIDLSGLPLERLTLDVGASKCEVEFSDPNPISLDEIKVDAGAGEVKIFGLGYANFENLTFDGGAGNFVLNFEGLQDGRRSVSVDVGVGAVQIELPHGYPVRVESDDGWFKKIELHDSELTKVDDGVYESKDFDRDDRGLVIKLDVGMGKATITRVD